MPAYLDTGLNLVDVRDVAEGTFWPAKGAGWGALHSGQPEPDAATDL